MFIEGFAAIDDSVSYSPGTPQGSPWVPGTLGRPTGLVQNFTLTPQRTFNDMRGGARVVFNTQNATWSVAHYYSYADIPAVQSCVHPGTGFNGFPIKRLTTQDQVLRDQFNNQIPGCRVGPTDRPVTQERPICQSPGNDGVFGTPDDQPPGCRQIGEYDIIAPISFTVQTPAKIQVSGVTTSFNVPARYARLAGLSGEPIVRMELAYIKDEPYHRQSQLDPFLYHPLNPQPGQVPLATGGILKRDSINFVLGVDHNQWLRFLNTSNTFFITTQFFYKHINRSRSRRWSDRSRSDRADSRHHGRRPVPPDLRHQHLLPQRDDQPHVRLLLRVEWRACLHSVRHVHPRALPLHGAGQLSRREPPEGKQRHQPPARSRQRPISVGIRDLRNDLV
jgi:hypothetical protein